MKAALYLGAVLLVGFSGCQKEPEDDLLDTTPTCKPDKIYYYDAGSLYDSVSYVYFNDRLMEVHYAYDSFFTALEYKNELISKRNYVIEGSNQIFAFDKINYNPDSTLKSVQFYYIFPGVQFLFQEYEFTWTNGKLNGLLHKIDTSGTGSGTIPYLRYTFSYTGENISTTVEEDLFEQESNTYNYTYNNTRNYYRQMPVLFLTDNLFFGFDGSLLPFGISMNNVTGFSLTGVGSRTVSLVPDANGGPKQLLIDGEQIAQYFYTCQ